MIGNTPMVYIDELRIFAKLEKNNPGGSVKDRAAFFMLKGAIKDGIKTRKIVEPTSGNTGIALAWIGRKLGFDVILTMPDTMTKERIDIMRSFGADVVLTPGDKGMKGAIEKAKEIVNEKNAFMPNQFSNKYNILAHKLTTGPEVLEQMRFDVDVFVAGVGTGGTITGVGNVLKSILGERVKIVAVEPENSPVLSGGNPGKHKIQGIGAGFIPKILDLDVIDEIVKVSDEEVLKMFVYLNRKLGLNVGISSAANALVAARFANFGKVVTIFPDDVSKYISVLNVLN
ncbi:cysteine synthase [Thermosipho melanesiensis]|uniref:cysteine synthase n=2 Tax=Thermosipho melanesiensis TaxID=46541 RepID=A6LMD3_THEM4|nr:cysteine synthase family protein [Thermosipho melanesiensis]ABR31084.1 Pyridoxal-5'-phosphate-dependent enzyme, beta subunit [Thermosipho melanesiensis BI429]APT74179.1 cysteine synthase [Thermosipho melanesiensis]OOC36123.1 cysteine synthase [Thermosipho melanesiensis]OOC36940.1 cysteine synthase [Thermosipho melanesiensis]OOC37692.1 cysteine synthase [Thermosipho melanesiensis]